MHAQWHDAWLPLPVVDFGSRSLHLACLCMTQKCLFSALSLTVPQAAVPTEANEGTAGQHRGPRGICRRTGCLHCCCCCHSRSSGGCRQQQAAVHCSIPQGEQGPFRPDPGGLGRPCYSQGCQLYLLNPDAGYSQRWSGCYSPAASRREACASSSNPSRSSPWHQHLGFRPWVCNRPPLECGCRSSRGCRCCAGKQQGSHQPGTCRHCRRCCCCCSQWQACCCCCCKQTTHGQGLRAVHSRRLGV